MEGSMLIVRFIKYFIVICLFYLCCSKTLIAQEVEVIADVEGGVTLSWDPNKESDLAGYKIYFGLTAGNYDTVIDVKNVTQYTVGKLIVGTDYYFVITAYDTWNNESEYSDEVTATAKDIIVPKKVSDFREVTPSVNNSNK
jgi:hypothetical protein